VAPLLLAVLAVWLLVSLFGNRNPVDYITRSIPGGVQLQYARHGVEGKLLSFLEDSTQSVDRQVWFDFDRLLFETNSAVLKSGSQDQLRNIAAILKAYPNARVKIGGYTDTSGDPAANMKLSQDRANSVMQELTNLGVASGRLSAEGYGGTNPVADNATEAGRAKNRRVALRVTEK
jgi:outer membrane protein OmpA-like peptidoglycan-associated protein